MALTGNPNVDVRILFSLPDKELLRLCSTSREWRSICEARENDMYWRERYEQRFPHVPLPALINSANYRELYLRTVAQREINLGPGIRDPYCLFTYLRYLSRVAYAWADRLTEEAIVKQLRLSLTTVFITFKIRRCAPGTDFRTLVVGELLITLNSLAVNLVRQQSGCLIATPWDINQVILNNPLLHEIFSDIRVDLPVTICIAQQCTSQRLSKPQFIGMLLYLHHNLHLPTTFSLLGCPLQYSTDYLQTCYNVRNRGYILTMHDRSRYSLPTSEVKEIMQGFTTMARWLGRNYRAGYATLWEVSIGR